MSNQERAKPVYQICDVELVSAETFWPGHEQAIGRNVAVGIMVLAKGTLLGGDTRTSPIIAGSIEEGQVETLNSIYQIVERPADQEKTDNGLWGACTPMMGQQQKVDEDA